MRMAASGLSPLSQGRMKRHPSLRREWGINSQIWILRSQTRCPSPTGGYGTSTLNLAGVAGAVEHQQWEAYTDVYGGGPGGWWQRDAVAASGKEVSTSNNGGRAVTAGGNGRLTRLWWWRGLLSGRMEMRRGCNRMADD
uniref:Uncharacterized protein n=1 Tax=Oryza sativa subsp. japonica TaxID=39947 RepID=Q5ZC95_ORYSJ|nr:hypothetical protein [Oryza sativa Japonica Group]BAD88346.1 hypothetical protein [Oryza sativa Japonica Group]